MKERTILLLDKISVDEADIAACTAGILQEAATGNANTTFAWEVACQGRFHGTANDSPGYGFGA